MTALELGAPLAWAGLLQLAAWGVGQPLLRAIDAGRPAPRAAVEHHFLAGVVGWIALAQTAVALAFLGALHAELLLAIALVAAGIGALEAARGIRRAHAAGALTWAALRPRWVDAPLGLALGVLFSRLPQALYPVLRHDDAAYHLALPRTYLAEHGFDALPFSHYANMPHAIEVLYAFALASGDFLAAKVLSVTFAGWTLLGLAAFLGNRPGRSTRSVVGIAALLYVAAPNVVWHLGLGYVEIALGVWLLGALVALRAMRTSAARSDAVLLGLCCGAALASKYTGWLFAAPILLAGIVFALRAPVPRREQWQRIAAFAALTALSVAPWLLKNAWYTGNPIYPNLYSWFGGVHWSEAQALHLARSMAFAGGAQGGVLAALSTPIRFVLAPGDFFSEAFSAPLVVAFLAALAGVGLSRERRAEDGWLAAVAVGGVLAWAVGVQQGRFLVAWLPVAAAFAASGLAPLRARPRSLAAVATAVVLASAAQLALQPTPGAAAAWDTFRVPRSELIARNPHYEVTQYLNEVVPPGGKVLGMWENRLFFLDRTLHADTAWEAPQILSALRARDDAAAFAADLIADGFTHGVITHTAQKYLDNARMFDLIDEDVYPESQLARDRELVETLLRDHADIVFETETARVFRLR